jgi:N-succinyldiaminopimelate aminotransferase
VPFLTIRGVLYKLEPERGSGRTVHTLIYMSRSETRLPHQLATPRTAEERPGRHGVSIYETMSDAAANFGAINLGQAMPDMLPPLAALHAAASAMHSGGNTYSASAGLPALREQVALFGALGGEYDAVGETTIFAGSTEALAATLLAFAGSGSEVLAFEPFYDDYPLHARMAGARFVGVPLRDRHGRFQFEPDELERRISPASRVLVLNTPHNPTGTVFNDEELAAIAKVAHAANLIVVADEVYEHYTYDFPHRSIASLPGMRQRTVVISSASKTFGLPGWRVGWALADVRLTEQIRRVHHSLSFCAPTPLQFGVAEALRSPELPTYLRELQAEFRARRDLLCAALSDSGFDPLVPQGAFFILARIDRWGGTDSLTFCLDLARNALVAALPMDSFFRNSVDGSRYVRFAFCRGRHELRLAGERLYARGA